MNAAQPPLTGYYRALLRRYLASESPDLDGTVHGFATPIEKGEDAPDRLWTAWGEVIRQAGMLAPENQKPLVDLVVRLRDRGVPPGLEEAPVIWDLELWSGLPMFGAQMREAWNWATPPQAGDFTWRNVNGFAARLTVAGLDFSLFALWTIRSSLEETAEVSMPELTAAAEWFRYLTQPILQWSQAERQFGGPEDPASRPGKLLLDQGFTQSGFSAARFDYWRRRIRQGSSRAGDPTGSIEALIEPGPATTNGPQTARAGALPGSI